MLLTPSSVPCSSTSTSMMTAIPSRLIIVSNRLPITLQQSSDGKHLTYTRSAGGLVTGLSSIENRFHDRVWVGWTGIATENCPEKETVTAKLRADHLEPVFLSEQEHQLFYGGFCNKTLWPHFHYFTQYTIYSDEYWESYCAVNRRFAEVVGDLVNEGDMVWVHDYQLMLVPGLLRANFPHLSIGFFLHIPFPSFELFRTLPWRFPILQGLLGADVIGFHTFDYMRHFLSTVYRITGYEHTFGRLDINGRWVKVDVFPMGIDYEKFANPLPSVSDSSEVKIIQDLSQKVKLILSVDRLDYSKGIPARIKAYKSFLQCHPEYTGKVALILVVVPSRLIVDQYSSLKEEIEVLVGSINGELSTFDWIPIRYFYRALNFDSLYALFRCCHIGLVTPFRDGMNLVAKEFVASKHTSQSGVLILSEMAGVASELDDALVVNPCDTKDISQALLTALEMSPADQSARLQRMQRTLRQNDLTAWVNSFSGSTS